MERQVERAATLRQLHVGGDPLILFNIWDPGSARVVAEAGARAIATGSWAVSVAHGFRDGQQMPFELVLDNLRRIVASVDVPVSVDLEAGYGDGLDDLRASVTAVIDAGAVGINIEDLISGGNELYALDEQCRRIEAVREAATGRGVSLFINARTDTFFRGTPAGEQDALMEEALRRANAYADAGADGFFVPGLLREDLLEELCVESPLPVNVMILPPAPVPRRLAELGVARISYGPGSYAQAMGALRNTAELALSPGDEPVISDWRLLSPSGG